MQRSRSIVYPWDLPASVHGSQLFSRSQLFASVGTSFSASSTAIPLLMYWYYKATAQFRLFPSAFKSGAFSVPEFTIQHIDSTTQNKLLLLSRHYKFDLPQQSPLRIEYLGSSISFGADLMSEFSERRPSLRIDGFCSADSWLDTHSSSYEDLSLVGDASF